MKPTVYIETSIPSYLTARASNDIRATANQNTTIEWWEKRKQAFELFISEFVVAEAARGHLEAVGRRMDAINDIPELKATDEVRILGKQLVSEGALPYRNCNSKWY